MSMCRHLRVLHGPFLRLLSLMFVWPIYRLSYFLRGMVTNIYFIMLLIFKFGAQSIHAYCLNSYWLQLVFHAYNPIEDNCKFIKTLLLPISCGHRKKWKYSLNTNCMLIIESFIAIWAKLSSVWAALIQYWACTISSI